MSTARSVEPRARRATSPWRTNASSRAMEARLPTLEMASKERYFAVLTILVGKLEAQEKTLREVLAEMMAEAGRHLMEELSAPR